MCLYSSSFFICTSLLRRSIRKMGKRNDQRKGSCNHDFQLLISFIFFLRGTKTYSPLVVWLRIYQHHLVLHTSIHSLNNVVSIDFVVATKIMQIEKNFNKIKKTRRSVISHFCYFLYVFLFDLSVRFRVCEKFDVHFLLRITLYSAYASNSHYYCKMQRQETCNTNKIFKTISI